MSSRHRGVSRNKKQQNWMVHIWFKGKSKYLGKFHDEADAGRAYDAFVVSKKLDRPLNFPSASGAAGRTDDAFGRKHGFERPPTSPREEAVGRVSAPPDKVVGARQHFFNVRFKRFPPNYSAGFIVGARDEVDATAKKSTKGIFVTAPPADGTRLRAICPWIVRGDELIAVDGIRMYTRTVENAILLLTKHLKDGRPRNKKQPCTTVFTFASAARLPVLPWWSDGGAASPGVKEVLSATSHANGIPAAQITLQPALAQRSRETLRSSVDAVVAAEGLVLLKSEQSKTLPPLKRQRRVVSNAPAKSKPKLPHEDESSGFAGEIEAEAARGHNAPAPIAPVALEPPVFELCIRAPGAAPERGQYYSLRPSARYCSALVAARARSDALTVDWDPSAAAGECSFMYRYILRESCSQFDSLPLTSLTILDWDPSCRDGVARTAGQGRRPVGGARRARNRHPRGCVRDVERGVARSAVVDVPVRSEVARARFARLRHPKC